eukprot:TRINITY_DN23157_c0_g1_i1.p1 TRINITY_DN23157_c0_g1~~TRINITY_DN23157_c0_g1_i1.p1  ORF type:complete len:443 (+),score=66.81 TRINITY_DN23157_c0_g1_i1:607-1935(+)
MVPILQDVGQRQAITKNLILPAEIMSVDGPSYPVKISCLQLSRDWSFTAWVQTAKASANRAQTVFFYGTSYPSDYVVHCQVQFNAASTLLCEFGGKTLSEQSLLQLGDGVEQAPDSEADASSSTESDEPTPWNHFAVTRSTSGDVKMYWNGIVQPTLKGTAGVMDISGASFFLGSLIGSQGKDWHGAMDEVSVWGRVLGEKEVQSVRDQTSAFNSARLRNIIGRLQLLLDFEDTLSVARDTSGNNLRVDLTLSATLNSVECQRGAHCMQFYGHKNGRPLSIPCLRLRQDWTFSAWVRTATLSRDQNIFFLGSSYNSSFVFSCTVKYTSSSILCEGPGSFGKVETDSQITANEKEWHHFAVSRRAADGTVTLYWDGDEKGSAALATGYMPELQDSAPRSFLLGSAPGQEDTEFSGLMDEVSVWSRQLSGSEVKRMRGPAGPFG